MVCYRVDCGKAFREPGGKYPIGTGVGSPRDSGSVSGRTELMDIMDMNWDGFRGWDGWTSVIDETTPITGVSSFLLFIGLEIGEPSGLVSTVLLEFFACFASIEFHCNRAKRLSRPRRTSHVTTMIIAMTAELLSSSCQSGRKNI